MATLRPPDPTYSAVIFDLDETLIDSRPAWCYTLEETVMSVCHRRVDAKLLVAEYRHRPWRDALAIVVDAPDERQRCEELCERIGGRSAVKRLLVFDGVGMALDEIRGQRIEVGVISRLPHALALKQAQATGLDRFVTVLSPTPVSGSWEVAERAADCLAYFGRPAESCLFVGAAAGDVEAGGAIGLAAAQAGWAYLPGESDRGLARPHTVLDALAYGLDARGLPLRTVAS